MFPRAGVTIVNDEDLAAGVRAGDRRALARALTTVENRRPQARRLVAELYPHTGKAAVWGLTGPPGVGKSTLADAIATHALGKGHKVAILAIDPSSPFTGGAFLGDRTRMEGSSQSSEIFIRSMATRGHVGGLAAAVFEAITLLDAAGRDLILVETVGVGQDEVEVAAAVGLTLVVLAPGQGDELQANKAGLLEIADVLVVNKADREGADRLADELASAHRGATRSPAIVSTVATTGDGVDRLYETVVGLDASPETRRRRFVEGWLREVLQQTLRENVRGRVWKAAVDSVLSRATDPFAAAGRVFASIRDAGGKDDDT
jgi:LAO/AO transport system kinase